MLRYVSYREGGSVRQRVIAKLGREDELDPAAIARLVRSLAKCADVDRVLDPGSEPSLVRSFLPSVYVPEFDGIELQHAYRALQFLAEVGPELAARLTRVMKEKLFADASFVLFDTTSTSFEGTGPAELASFGFSRDKRGDRAPLYRAGVTVSKTRSPTEPQQRLLAAIGAPLPERHAAV